MKKGYSKQLYTLASQYGLVESGNKDDPFHLIIYRVTGKDSTKDLTYRETVKIKNEILKMFSVPKMVSPAQQKCIIGLMCRLRSLDTEKSSASISQRLVGIIRKELHITASTEQPFRWVSNKDASKLIVILGKYIESAEKKCRSDQEDKRVEDG